MHNTRDVTSWHAQGSLRGFYTQAVGFDARDSPMYAGVHLLVQNLSVCHLRRAAAHANRCYMLH